MAFGPSGGENTATGAQSGAGVPMLGQGANNLNTAGNFFSNILNGNQADVMQQLRPSINQLRQQQQGTLQGISTMMPRGGGQFQSLFQQPWNVNSQVGSLFSGLRSGAGSALAGIGGTQGQLGTQNAQNLFQNAFQQRQYNNNMIGSTIGAGLSLATTPFGGGTASNGLFGLIPGIGGH